MTSIIRMTGRFVVTGKVTNRTPIPVPVSSVTVWVQAGGGGGGASHLNGRGGGGGGAGGLWTGARSVVQGTTYSIVVGSGGSGGVMNQNIGNGLHNGVNGTNSSALGITVLGGGAGFVTNVIPYPTTQSIGDGGCGGGAGGTVWGGRFWPPTNTPGFPPFTGTSGAGYDFWGGSGGGGGGRWGAAGGRITWPGGSPQQVLIGSSRYFLQGGGNGGPPTGDRRNYTTYAGTAGYFGYGGGGGSGDSTRPTQRNGINGLNGVVFIVYPQSFATAASVTGGVYNNAGGSHIYMFTTSGTIRW